MLFSLRSLRKGETNVLVCFIPVTVDIVHTVGLGHVESRAVVSLTTGVQVVTVR